MPSFAIFLTTFTSREARQLEFCYYRATQKSALLVRALIDEDDDGSIARKKTLFRTPPLNVQPHNWICEQVPLAAANYDAVSVTSLTKYLQSLLKERYAF